MGQVNYQSVSALGNDSSKYGFLDYIATDRSIEGIERK